ncbi:MAG: extracellular solute-binding protein [Chromatiaceae bacterium]|nr:extracellular solute-binding protein [Chromatiaceae bacterium]MCP5414975.1 extracellular solute-binding protein [Chromatiaceae bacterium]HPE81896.1 extracellular solute-binding protein [Gammaproteobacteria bacterium]
MLRLALSVTVVAVLLSPLVVHADEVVVYSARNEHLIKPLFDRYTQETGVQIRYITDKEGPLLQRLAAEGARTPADMLITVDAGNLWHAAQSGVLAEISSPVLEANVPVNLRDPKGRWFGLSERARTIVYSTERVQPGELSSYEDLADPKWQGRLCLRTSKKVYNQSLVASLIARHGEERAEQIVRGWVANLAAEPFSNDTKAMEAVAAGQCDVTIVNTYYFGRLEKERPDIPLALFWPNQDSSGVHINVSGAGVTAHAKHPEAAQQLLEWLSSETAQGDFAGLNMEYPVNKTVAPDPIVSAWGTFKADDLNVNEAGRLQADAIRLMDRAGYR